MSFATVTEISVVPGDTAVHQLFASSTPCNMALIFPLPSNTNATQVLFGSLNPPLNIYPITLPYIPGARPYDLSLLTIKAANTTDGVLVIYTLG